MNMEENSIAMTQDCVEWNEDDGRVDLRKFLSNTPSKSSMDERSKYNPVQEIENIWNLLDEPTNSTKKIRRAHSYPISRNPHRNRNRSIAKGLKERSRKRKRPSSADSTKKSAFARVSEQKNSTVSESLGFEDLLKQLDTPDKDRKKSFTTSSKNDMPHNINDGRANSQLFSNVHKKQISSTPVAHRKIQQIPSSLGKLSGSMLNNRNEQKGTRVNNSRGSLEIVQKVTPPLHDAQQSIKQQAEKHSSTKSGKEISNNLSFKSNETICGSDEFGDDEFELSESDLAALDAAVMASQANIEDTAKLKCSQGRNENMNSDSFKENVLPGTNAKGSSLTKVNSAKNHSLFNENNNVKETPPVNGKPNIPKFPKMPTAESNSHVISTMNRKDENDSDEFGDFDLDFEDLDKKIEEHSKPKPLSHEANSDIFDDSFNGEIDFEALDKKIAEHTQDRAAKRDLGISSLQLPPQNTKVTNMLASEKNQRQPSLSFSRYKIVAVCDDAISYTKALLVKSWRKDMSDGHIFDRNLLHHPGTRTWQKKMMQGTNQEEVGEGWIFLCGEWYHTPVEKSDTINLCSVSGRYQTNAAALPVILHTQAPFGSDAKDDLILVLHPDIMIPPTIISEAISCTRKAVLRSRVGSTGISSKSALYGIIRHNLFEECMNKQDFNFKFVKEAIFSILRREAEGLVALGIKEGEAKAEMLRILPQLQQFHCDFMGGKDRYLNTAGKLEGRGIEPDMNICIHSVEGTEENLVSPEFGVKGKLDVTVKASTQELSFNGQAKVDRRDTNVVGIELKTGHFQQPQTAHTAQLALYTLLLSARYGKTSTHDGHASNTGMLLYLNQEGMRAIRVSPLISDLKSLIGQRNSISSRIKKSTVVRGITIAYEEDGDSTDDNPRVIIDKAPPVKLPELHPVVNQCNRCYVNRECMIYKASEIYAHKADLQNNCTKSPHEKLLSHFCGHLNDQDYEYFLEWDRLIDLEADATKSSISMLWLTPSVELESKTGRSISSLIFEETSRYSDMDIHEDTEFVPITLRRSVDSISKTDISKLSIEEGCHVVISTDNASVPSSEEYSNTSKKSIKKVMHIARGIVVSLDETTITVKVSRNERNQLSQAYDQEKIYRRELKLRVDRDEVHSGLGTIRQNLINLFTNDVPPLEHNKSDPKLTQNAPLQHRLVWLREVIVQLRPPSYDIEKVSTLFDQLPTKSKIPGCDPIQLVKEFQLLNADQQNAVEKVISSNDYTLIQGLPGTGKSSTIAFVVRLLAALGKRVLLTSYTHAAVDNLMIKLIDKGVGIQKKAKRMPCMVRIGKKNSTHPAVQPILLSKVASDLQQVIDGRRAVLPSADTIHAAISNARIVGVTALSIPRCPTLLGQKFDVVIVDEAGQINQPVIIGALMAADRFVLVGDHQQLRPLVISELADKAGYGVSMLSRLAEKHPDCVAQLTMQYRMHEDICRISNIIVYGGRLKCANEKVRTGVLQLSQFQDAATKLDIWVTRIINPYMPVVFVNTDLYKLNENLTKSKEIIGFESKIKKDGSGNMINDHEIFMVKRIIEGLIDSGLPASSIGVISPFRAQVGKLNNSTAFETWKSKGLEISTIDRYQGRDKQVIIITFVRSNKDGYSGRLLNDYRRLNVAVSRAMKKLIMVGSYSTLHSGSSTLRPILEDLSKMEQIENIPEQVLRSHV